MSLQLSAQARTEFEDEVKHQYDKADTGLLMSVRHKKINQAEDSYFPRFSKGQAKLRSARGKEDDVTGMGVESDRINIALESYEAPEYTDIFDQANTNVDDRRELAIVIAAAMSRRKEQTVIDAFSTTTFAANLNPRDAANKYKAFQIVHGGTGLSKEKINKAKAKLVARGVSGEFHFAANAEDLEGMLNDSTITSGDYNTVRALVDGEINTWCGFKWNFIPARPEGGLPFTDNGDNTATSKCYAYEKMSTGNISQLDRVEVNYIAEKTSWLSNGLFQTGSKVIDPEGLIEVQSLIAI